MGINWQEKQIWTTMPNTLFLTNSSWLSSTETNTDTVAMYKMCHVPRGVCLIINNENFSEARRRGHDKLYDREGSQVDLGKLCTCTGLSSCLSGNYLHNSIITGSPLLLSCIMDGPLGHLSWSVCSWFKTLMCDHVDPWGGQSNISVEHMRDQRFSKYSRDLLFWGRTPLNKNFAWFRTQFYPS